ncbi:MAG TPA: FAD-dependent oxidoreductase [Candidatus Dormibacteraeota bacterium]|nr:FAD-dependent oxidoreductase [Candidatus Dormibacteraeota bacterium]
MISDESVETAAERRGRGEAASRERRPVILAVGDDAETLCALAADLRRRYGSRFRTLRAQGGDRALAMIRGLLDRAQPVALVIADEHMTGMSVLDVLSLARRLLPDAGTVLLTPYTETEAAIRAIDAGAADDYVLTPWEPAEERLYPEVDDLLGEWLAGHPPAREIVRLVGHRWDADSHRVRYYLSRNQVPFAWYDLDVHPEERRLVEEAGGESCALPLVALPGGERLCDPSNEDLAERLGLSAHTETPFYDVIIVGAGPAGLGAAVYATSEGLSTAVVESEAPGGQAGLSSRIENYLGFPRGVSGGELTRRALAQARRFGAQILTPRTVARLEVRDPYRVLHDTNGGRLTARAVVVASGVSYRRLPAEGADRLEGRGVYYGADANEASLCAGESIAVVGGGNSAGQASLHFSNYARRVHLLVLGDRLTRDMSRYLVDRIERTPRITVHLRSEVTAVEGDEHVTGILLRDLDTGERTGIPVTSVYAFIGADPCTDWLAGTLERDPRGYLLTGIDLRRRVVENGDGSGRDPYLLETSVPGVFAAGDVRNRSMRRVAGAVGDGATAVSLIHQYLEHHGDTRRPSSSGVGV